MAEVYYVPTSTTINGQPLSGNVTVGGAASWGGISGTLSSQTDLQTTLDSKVASNDSRLSDARTPLAHNHDAAYATINHNHTGVYEPANANIQSHIGTAHAPSNAQKNSDITKAEIEVKLTGEISSHTHAGGGGGTLYMFSRVTGSNATTTGQALVDIPGLTFTALANSVYEFEANLSVQSSSTAGNAYGVNYSTAGATVEAIVTGTLTATSDKTLRISALNTAATPFVTVAATGGILIKGIFTTGANAGNLTIKHFKVTSGTATCFINSFLKVTKLP